MFFTKTTDQKALETLIRTEAADRKLLQKLESDLNALRPKWTALQDEAERLHAAYASNADTYRREVCALFWDERDPMLRARINALASERDGLTLGREQAIRDLKNRIYHRGQTISGDFASWVLQVSGQLPAPLAAELAQAKADVQRSQDLRAAITTVAKCAEAVAENDGPSVVIKLLNVSALIRSALAIAPPAAAE